MDTLDLLTERVERLELSNRRLRHVLYIVALVAVSCGAASTTSNFRRVNSHVLAVFGAAEEGEAITLERGEDGGRILLRDAKGNVRVRIDAQSVTVSDETGGTRWTSASAKGPPPG